MRLDHTWGSAWACSRASVIPHLKGRCLSAPQILRYFQNHANTVLTGGIDNVDSKFTERRRNNVNTFDEHRHLSEWLNETGCLGYKNRKETAAANTYVQKVREKAKIEQLNSQKHFKTAKQTVNLFSLRLNRASDERSLGHLGKSLPNQQPLNPLAQR